MKPSRLAAQVLALVAWLTAVLGAVSVGVALELSVWAVLALLIAASLGARYVEQRLMDAAADAPAPGAPVHADGLLRCSFCAKSQREVRKLIAGPSVYICDECIGLCNEILAEHAQPAPAAPPPENVYEPPAS